MIFFLVKFVCIVQKRATKETRNNFTLYVLIKQNAGSDPGLFNKRFNGWRRSCDLIKIYLLRQTGLSKQLRSCNLDGKTGVEI